MELLAPNPFDLRLLDACHGSSPGGALTAAMVAFTLVGSGWTMIALVPLFASRRARPFVVGLAAVWTMTALVVVSIKEIVRRKRPCAQLSFDALWGQTPTDYSFPSGHAAGAFAFAVFVAVLVLGLAEPESRKEAWRWAAVASAFAVATCIALSRVYLGVHFPTDVLGGALVGGVIGAVGARATHARRAKPRDEARRAPL